MMKESGGIEEGLLLGAFVEFPLDVEHEVAGQDVGVGLCTCLCVDAVVDIGQVVEYVEAVKHKCETAFLGSPAQTCIPYEIVSVESRIGVSTTAIHVEISGYAEIGR